MRLGPLVLLALPGLALPGLTPAQGAPPPRLVRDIPGACVSPLRLGARGEVPCAGTGAAYAVLEDGRAFVSVAFGPRAAVSFVGTRERHPTPDSYALVLDYVRVTEAGAGRDARAAGECHARLSATGAWTDLGCFARTPAGETFAFRFRPR